MSFEYNPHGEINYLSLQDVGTTVASSTIDWHPFGAVKSIAWSNGVTLKDTYDKNGRVDKKGLGSGINDYDWNDDGTLKAIKDPVATRAQSFDRDLMGRLSSWTQNAASRLWTYDLAGNIRTNV